MYKYTTAVLVFASSVFGSTPAAHACACCETWKVVHVAEDDVLNMRSGPGISHRIVGAIPSGSGCVIKSNRCVGNWCRVNYAGVRGWVSTRYLEFIP